MLLVFSTRILGKLNSLNRNNALFLEVPFWGRTKHKSQVPGFSAWSCLLVNIGQYLHRLLSLHWGNWDFSVLLLIFLFIILLFQVTVNLLRARPVGVSQGNRHSGQGRGPRTEAVAGRPVITDKAGFFTVGWRADAVNAAVTVRNLLTIPRPRSQQEQAAGGLTLRELGHWWLQGWLWQHGWLWGTWTGARGWPIRGDNHRFSEVGGEHIWKQGMSLTERPLLKPSLSIPDPSPHRVLEV